MNIRDAERLRDVVNAGLADAFDQMKNGFDFGGVNWGDLGCTDIEQRTSQLHPSNPAVIYAVIEEAAPDAHKLCKFIEEHLKKNGFPDVAVVTEW